MKTYFIWGKTDSWQSKKQSNKQLFLIDPSKFDPMRSILPFEYSFQFPSGSFSLKTDISVAGSSNLNLVILFFINTDLLC
jgi:hypothetical protein